MIRYYYTNSNYVSMKTGNLPNLSSLLTEGSDTHEELGDGLFLLKSKRMFIVMFSFVLFSIMLVSLILLYALCYFKYL